MIDPATRPANNDMGKGKCPPKKVLAALERIFSAEINGLLPFQSKAAIYKELLASGLVFLVSRSFGPVVVSGYELTHAGRYLYCSNCDEEADDAK